MLNVEKVATGLPPNILEHFYDLRALAMNAKALIRDYDEGSDELNAAGRVLSILSDKALEFANEADEFLLHLPGAQTTGESEVQHG